MKSTSELRGVRMKGPSLLGCWCFTVLIALSLLPLAVPHALAMEITPVAVRAWPNERTQDGTLLVAIDGDLTTFTWTTASYTSSSFPNSLGLDFGLLTAVNRIRLWKDDASGSPGNPDGVKDLLVQYTSDDPGIDLTLRTWRNVSGLINGFQGAELMVATSVNLDGSVTGDVHDSVNEGHGWASLTFDGVLATGVRIIFIEMSGVLFNHYKIHEFQAHTAPLQVGIDIKPGSFPNSINPNSQGVIPVAILTTGTFDATTVDPTTVHFGRTGTEAAPVQSALEDVDGDGDIDMILHFNTQDTGIVCGDTSASLTGDTVDGQMIEGSDSIKTVGCK